MRSDKSVLFMMWNCSMTSSLLGSTILLRSLSVSRASLNPAPIVGLSPEGETSSQKASAITSFARKLSRLRYFSSDVEMGLRR